MWLEQVGEAVVKALTAVFNDIADYAIQWDIVIGFFAAVVFYYLFKLLIGWSINESRPPL